MSDILYGGLNQLYGNMIQAAAGIIIAYGIFTAFRKIGFLDRIGKASVWLIPIFALAGMALPLGIYGVVPIAVILLNAGFAPYAVIPLIASNWLFNMLVPYESHVFLWSNSGLQLLTACAAGILSGILAKFIIKGRAFRLIDFKKKSVWVRFGLFLLIGSFLGPLYRDYLYQNLINHLAVSPSTMPLFGQMGGMIAFNMPFILALSILENMMDMTLLSGLLFLYRKRGLAIHYLSYLAAVVCLAAGSFFVK